MSGVVVEWRRREKASPMACEPVVQAVLGERDGPRKLYFMLMWPAARLIRSRGTKRGETRR
jgi:hypothetical protein